MFEMRGLSVRILAKGDIFIEPSMSLKTISAPPYNRTYKKHCLML
jgi:hypothetical protein